MYFICKDVGFVFYVEESDGLSMRKERNQKWICLFLVIAVMILGICLEKIPADSYFSCKQESTIAKADGVLRDISAYKTETLSQREVLSSLRSAKRELRRNQVRTSALLGNYLSSEEFLPQIFQSKQAAGGDSIYCKTSCSAAILSYIHNQDGEKA